MRILILSEPSYPKHPGGAGKCAHLLAVGLVQRGHEVHLVCPGDEFLRETISGVTVHRLRLPNLQTIDEERINAHATLDYIEQTLSPQTLDVVHDCGCFLSHHFRVSQHLKSRYRAVTVAHFQFITDVHERQVSERSFDPMSEEALWFHRYGNDAPQCFVTRTADALVCTSYEEAYHCHRLFRPEPGRMEVIPNPADMGLRQLEASERLRARISTPQELVVMFGGRLDSRMKGADIVLDAFRCLMDRGLRIRLLTTSNGQEAERRFDALLGQQTTALGWLPDAQQFAIALGAADVVLMPSRYEPFGLICAEAMAVGVPVIGSPVGGLRQMIRSGQNGFLLEGSPTDWPRQLAGRLEQLATTPGLSQRLGEEALQTARRSWSQEAVAAALEHLYRRLLETTDLPAFSPPAFTDRDRHGYVALLEELIQAPAESLGGEVLDGWSRAVETHCQGCVRSCQASSAHRLLRLGRSSLYADTPSRKAAQLERVRQTAHRLCPLWLSRLDYLRRWTGIQESS
jgi:glycosyltransferase involved in cell wall biosynthesis